MSENLARPEKGIKWWLRYVIVPLIGSGGLLGVYMSARQIIPSRPAENVPTASLPAGAVEPLPGFTPTPTAGLTPGALETQPVFTPTPTAWPPGEAISSDPRSQCALSAAGLADPVRENAVVVQFKITGKAGYCTWTTPLYGFNAGAMKQVSFWVKGKKGGEPYELALGDSRTPADLAPKVSRTATASWNQVVIPLDRFSGLDMASLEELSLTVRSGGSAIYVDRIVFLP